MKRIPLTMFVVLTFSSWLPPSEQRLCGSALAGDVRCRCNEIVLVAGDASVIVAGFPCRGLRPWAADVFREAARMSPA